MSYRKVTEGGATIYPKVSSKDDPTTFLGKSFIGCPRCDNNELQSTMTEPKSYMCTVCGWKYLTPDMQEKRTESKDGVTMGLLHPYTLPH